MNASMATATQQTPPSTLAYAEAAVRSSCERILLLLGSCGEPLRATEISHLLGYDIISTAARLTMLLDLGAVVSVGHARPYRYAVAAPPVAATVAGWGSRVDAAVGGGIRKMAARGFGVTHIIRSVLSYDPALAAGITTGDIRERFGVDGDTARDAHRLLREIARHG